jgi:eukaryotic-like serine/threonine-protein kinase
VAGGALEATAPAAENAPADRREVARALPDWSAAPHDAAAHRELMSRRVAYFGGVFLVLSLAFYVRNAAAIALLERAWPPLAHPAFLLHTAAIGLHAAQWLVARRPARSLASLYRLDAAGLLLAMVLYGLVTVAEASTFEHAVAVQSAGAEVLLVGLIMLALVLTHAIIVPLDEARMLRLSAAACSLGVVFAYWVSVTGLPAELIAAKPWLPVNQVVFVGMWALLATSVSRIAARVIHGLQQRVRDANEIGQYTLEQRIGEGGMGVVYLARHALLRRPTAIKLLPPERAGELTVRRFEQEVRLTSALTHPNTIAIYDFGRTPDGVFYYAMEYLDGLTLEELIEHAGPQPPARVVQILTQVCGALSEAHAVGLIHRDIKPANLMLCVRGRVPDQVKVLDFGLVKMLAAEVAPGLSREGALVGTPAYLAPETIVDPARVDARSDLYALGAVGYGLLAGQPVFDSATIVEVCAHHLHSQPVPPSERLAARAGASIPADLEDIILRCLAKDPAARPASALELMRSLLAIVELGPWSTADAERWWRDEAPEIMRQARSQRRTGGSPGPRTVAVDLDRRSDGYALGPRAELRREGVMVET